MEVMRLHDRGLRKVKFLNLAGLERDYAALVLQNAFDDEIRRGRARSAVKIV